ncbi:hypothetical protein NFJ02_03g99980 [Pycnococcus provasolii]
MSRLSSMSTRSSSIASRALQYASISVMSQSSGEMASLRASPRTSGEASFEVHYGRLGGVRRVARRLDRSEVGRW